MGTLKGYDIGRRPDLIISDRDTSSSYIQQPSSVKFAENTPSEHPTSLKSAETSRWQQPITLNASQSITRKYSPYNSVETIAVEHLYVPISAANVDWSMLTLEESVLAYGQLDECPSIDSFLCTLQKCRKQRSLIHAVHIHLHICNHGLETHFVLKSHLVSLFVECGSMPFAQHAFNRLRERNEFAWTCLMHGYVDSGEPQHALKLVQEMKADGILLTEFTYVVLLKACARLQCLERGQELHEELRETGIGINLFVGSALVDMYAKCGSLEKAQDVFDGLSDRSIVSWTALIAGYAEYGSREKAIECLEKMGLEGVSPDAGSFVCSLKALKNLEDLGKGFAMHSEIVKRGFEKDMLVGHGLMDMYAKCGSLEETQGVFDKLPTKNVVSWTILISRYADCGRGEEALKCLEQMQVEGECPNDITLVCSLKACKDLGALDKGQEIHTVIAREELEKVPYVCNTLVDLYATHRLLEEAHDVFKELQVHDVVLWTTLITGYAACDCIEEALSSFEQMQREGVHPDIASFNAVILGCATQDIKSERALRLYTQMQEQGLLPNLSTLMGVLKACQEKSVLAFGKAVHAQLLTSYGAKALDIQLATVLLDMYAKCGSMQDAQYIFDCMPTRDIVAWTALITGYAGRGESELVFDLLNAMKGEGMWPDAETFLSVLITCTHEGLVDEGLMLFESMKDFGITPTLEHLNCIVDLLGRVGRLSESVTMLKRSVIPPDPVMWATVLAACCKWHDVQVARHAFESAINLDKRYTPAYSLMANICADAGLWEELQKVEEMRAKQG